MKNLKLLDREVKTDNDQKKIKKTFKKKKSFKKKFYKKVK